MSRQLANFRVIWLAKVRLDHFPSSHLHPHPFEGVCFYTLAYDINGQDSPDAHLSSATYNGFLHFSGEINGRKGEIVIQCTGTYGPQTGAVDEWKAIGATGTGELYGLEMTGGFTSKEMSGTQVRLAIAEKDEA